MIASFKHKGLKRLFENAEAKGVQPDHLDRIVNILGILNVAEKLTDLDLPSLRLHPLKGKLKGFHGVTVHANWRIIFRFDKGSCHDVDLVVTTRRQAARRIFRKGVRPCR